MASIWTSLVVHVRPSAMVFTEARMFQHALFLPRRRASHLFFVGGWYAWRFYVLKSFYAITWRNIWKLLREKMWFWRQLHVFKMLYHAIFGKWWQLSRDRRRFGRQLHASKPFYDDILGRILKLLRDKGWCGRQFYVFEPLCNVILGKFTSRRLFHVCKLFFLMLSWDDFRSS